MNERSQLYSADDIYSQIRAGGVSENNKVTLQQMLNYDYLHATPQEFNSIVNQLETRNAKYVSPEEKDAAQRDGRQITDPEQTPGDIHVARDLHGNVKRVRVLLNDGFWHRAGGALMGGDKVFDRNDPNMMQLGRFDFDQNYYDQRAAAQGSQNYYDRDATARSQDASQLDAAAMQRRQDEEIRHCRELGAGFEMVKPYLVHPGQSWNTIARDLLRDSEPDADAHRRRELAGELKRMNGGRKYPWAWEEIKVPVLTHKTSFTENTPEPAPQPQYADPY